MAQFDPRKATATHHPPATTTSRLRTTSTQRPPNTTTSSSRTRTVDTSTQDTSTTSPGEADSTPTPAPPPRGTNGASTTHNVSHNSASVDNSQNSNVNAVDAVSARSKKTGLAVGLTFGILITIALIIAFFVWRRRKAGRERRERNKWKTLWNVDAVPPSGPKFGYGSGTDETALLNEKPASSHDDPFSASLGKPLPPEPPVSSLSMMTPPPNTFNNPVTIYQSSPQTLQLRHEGPLTTTPERRPEEETARVRRGFLPSLPDELPISIGETITLITVYDDGWCLCRGDRGERGMVPLECLDRTKQSRAVMSSQDGRRVSRRASSLYDGIVPGMY